MVCCIPYLFGFEMFIIYVLVFILLAIYLGSSNLKMSSPLGRPRRLRGPDSHF